MSTAKSLIIAIIAFMSIAEASAQFGGWGGGMGGPRGSRGERSASGDNAGGLRNRNDRQTASDPNGYEAIEYRLALLQEDLKPAGNQVVAWQDFSNKVRSYATDLMREKARTAVLAAGGSQVNGLQHIGRIVDTARNRLTALEDLEASAKVLYGTLSSEQQALADTRIPTIIAPRLTRADLP